MDGVYGIAGVLAILVCVGSLLGAFDRSRFSFRWLMVAAGLILLNDLLLTNGYGILPEIWPSAKWNWQGKALALIATLAVAASPKFGWSGAGLTLRQTNASLKSAVPIALAYISFFCAIAILFPDDPASAETVAFQLTMPGLEEEAFYRGLLLLALDRAFTGRIRFLGVEWGWGAALSCGLFGLAHAFGYSNGGYTFDPLIMALTAVPSSLAVWLRLRTGSLLVPIILHNVGNSASFIV